MSCGWLVGPARAGQACCKIGWIEGRRCLVFASAGMRCGSPIVPVLSSNLQKSACESIWSYIALCHRGYQLSDFKIVGTEGIFRSANGQTEVSSALVRAYQAGAILRQPLHLRFRSAILTILADGIWSPGDKLPAERDLAEEIGISLGTVQKTLNALAIDGVLVRRHGHGTFVAGDATQASQLAHFRFEGTDGHSIAPVYAEAVDRRIVRERGLWAQFLQDSKAAILITRRINVADEFDCISDFYVDADRFGYIMDMPIEKLHRTVIRHFIAREFDAPTLFATQSVIAGPFSERIRRLLKAGAGSDMGLILQIRSRTHGDAPISFQQIFIPSTARPLALPSPRLT